MSFFKKIKFAWMRRLAEPIGARAQRRESDGAARVAILGDIHSNLDALNTVLADLEAQGVTQIICTGDVVGYGANPSECLQIIRELNCPVVQGNHDSYAATGRGLKEFNFHAMSAILWTREQLSDAEKQWLLALPIECPLNLEPVTRSAHLVHSTVVEPERWHYILKPERAEVALRAQEPDLVFFGHTHVPSLFSFDPKKESFASEFPTAAGIYPLVKGRKYLMNPGSVGQPRDRDSRASYAIYDPDEQTIEIRRIAYDIAAAQKKIRAVGLPARNAERLRDGR